MKTTFNVLFLKDNKIFEIHGDGSLIPFDIDSNEISENYLLVLDDSYFFYVTPDIPIKNTRKLPFLIHNYLIANYPEELVKNYHFLERKGNLLTYMLSEELLGFMENNKDLFENASVVTTPVLMQWEQQQTKNFFDGKRFYSFNQNKITYLNNSDNYVSTMDVLLNVNSMPEKSIEFPGIRQERSFLSKFKKSAVVLGIAYIFFVAGLFLHLLSEKNNLNKIDNKISELYKKAGVYGKPDPYGLLLYKANKGKDKNVFRLMPLFEIFSVSIPSDTVINGFYYKNRVIKIEGITSDFLKIDEFKNNLEKSLKGSVFIGNTIKQNNKIKFTITCRIIQN